VDREGGRRLPRREKIVWGLAWQFDGSKPLLRLKGSPFEYMQLRCGVNVFDDERKNGP